MAEPDTSSKKTGCLMSSMKALMEMVRNCRIQFLGRKQYEATPVLQTVIPQEYRNHNGHESIEEDHL